jgi:type VI secretion system protein VasD
MGLSIRLGRTLTGLLIAAILASLAACGSKPPKEIKPPPAPPAPPPQLRVNVAAASNANRGPAGQALPIVVRLYELKAQGAFSGADFFSLYDRESETLGGELIAREELTLAPGQAAKIDKPLNPEARYLGVLGAYRDIDRASWRSLVPLISGKDNNLDIAVGATAIGVQTR